MSISGPREDRPANAVTTLLTATVIGVYVLVVVGATTAILDGAASCATWPACTDSWTVTTSDPAQVAAWGHRLTALLVGGLLLLTTVVVWRRSPDRGVRALTLGACLLYPVEVGVGAVIAVSGPTASLSVLHLVVAMAVVSTLLVALLWHLESQVAARVETEWSDPIEPTPTDPTPTSFRTPSLRERIGLYVSMTKPRLMWLLCLVALAGMGLAAGPTIDPGTVVATLAGGVLAIGASGTFNNVLERDRDAEMERTADRPLVHEYIPVRNAIVFGTVLAAASVSVFLLFVNVLAAGLGALAILYYSVVYTVVLKPNTTQNIVVGGAVGAFPALIGWAAVQNTVGVPALVLGAVIFLWTPAHFYNLALAYADDYERAGFPMLPVVRGRATTRRHILLYLGATFLGAVVLGTVTALGWLYATAIVAVSGVFLWAVVRLFAEQTEQAAFRAFHASNAYLGTLLGAVVIDTMLI